MVHKNNIIIYNWKVIFIERFMKTTFLIFSRFGIFIICLLSISAFLYAQSPQENRSTAMEIETLLSTDIITYAQASRFALEAADVMVTDNPEEAFKFAVESGWLPKSIASDDPVRLNHLSLLFMRSFDIKGGIMYSITKKSHYAYRELVYLNIITNRSDPAMTVSGERFLSYVNKLIARQETQAARIAVVTEEQQEN